MFFQLHTADLDAPGIGCFVEQRTHFGINEIAAGQRLIEFEVANDVA